MAFFCWTVPHRRPVAPPTRQTEPPTAVSAEPVIVPGAPATVGRWTQAAGLVMVTTAYVGRTAVIVPTTAPPGPRPPCRPDRRRAARAGGRGR
ncbi:hypothetical protein K7G98_11395 [Saccharothrix sp. MB29]|nr:hypothetical protein [Saccharothrix sp. MB29]